MNDITASSLVAKNLFIFRRQRQEMAPNKKFQFSHFLTQALTLEKKASVRRNQGVTPVYCNWLLQY